MGIIGHALKRRVFRAHDLLHEFTLLLLLGSEETALLAFLLIEDFLQVTLSFEVEFFDPLRVVDCLRVYLFVANYDTFPDCFIALLEVELEEFAVLDTPEGILDLDLLAQLALKERFLALEAACDVLRLYLDFELVGLGPLWDGYLHLNIEHSLRPVVLLRRVPIVRAYLLHLLHLLALRLGRLLSRCWLLLCGFSNLLRWYGFVGLLLRCGFRLLLFFCEHNI